LAEFRWILLGLGVLLIGGIWWWGARRSRQAPGNAELRESTAGSVVTPPHTFTRSARESAPTATPAAEIAETRDWGVPPLEPLSIRTADFERVPSLDQPMMIEVDPVELTMDLDTPTQPPPTPLASPTAATISIPAPAQTAQAAPPPPTPKLPPNTENSDRLAAVTATPHVPNSSEMQRIVTIRVCTVGDARWSGTALMAALEVHGLAYGRYQVYHRKHSDGRSIFCVASLIEPGTFDIARMPGEEFRGVTLFAVLPGPLEPVQTVDTLFATARDLARDLSGTVQDAKGLPFSPQRAAALREDVARFQAALIS
jgi:cell division protein ZipA